MDLTPDEMDKMAEYEDYQEFERLYDYQDKLRDDPDRLHSLLIEVGEISELKFFLQAIEEHRGDIVINFKNNTIEIQDEKTYVI